MNLVFIYGPPAAGKLTVGTEITKHTKHKLFHNHLTIDIAKELYPHINSQMFGLARKIRLGTFEYAAQQKTDIIFTFVFENSEEDNTFVKDAVDIVTQNGGKVLFVQLTAPVEALAERVNNESRKKMGKLTDREDLRTSLKQYDFNAAVPYDNILQIDTSKFTPEQSSQMIIDYYQLS